MELVAVLWVMALAGYVCIPILLANRAEASKQACLANLSEIGSALAKYMNDHDERWPFAAKLRSFDLRPAGERWPTLPTALAKYLPEDSSVWECPSDVRRLSPDDPLSKANPDAKSYYAAEGLSYEWWWGEARGGIRIGAESISDAKGFGYGRPDQRVLSDFEPFHRLNKGVVINTLFADFQARSVKGIAR